MLDYRQSFEAKTRQHQFHRTSGCRTGLRRGRWRPPQHDPGCRTGTQEAFSSLELARFPNPIDQNPVVKGYKPVTENSGMGLLLLSFTDPHPNHPQQRKVSSSQRSLGSDSDVSSDRSVLRRWLHMYAHSRAPCCSNTKESQLALATPRPLTKKTKRALQNAAVEVIPFNAACITER